MKTPFGVRLASVSVLSFLTVAGMTREATALIVVDNDVNIDWEACEGGRPRCAVGTVTGAPRLIFPGDADAGKELRSSSGPSIPS